MKANGSSFISEAVKYRDLGYVLEGIYEYKDGSGFMVFDNPDDTEDQKTIDLPTEADVQSMSQELDEEIQKINL